MHMPIMCHFLCTHKLLRQVNIVLLREILPHLRVALSHKAHYRMHQHASLILCQTLCFL